MPTLLSILARTALLAILVSNLSGFIAQGIIGPAMAQSDDDDDDDDRRRSVGSVGSDRDDPPAVKPVRRRPAPVRAPVALPRFVPEELVALSLSEVELAQLLALGYRVLEELPVPELGAISRRLSVPKGIGLEAAREQVRTLAPASEADFNHYYRTEEDAGAAGCDGQHCVSFQMIGWEDGVDRTCLSGLTIGVIDTGINADHPTFAASRLEVHRLTPGRLDPSRAIHGTAVTAMLIGDPESRSPGLLPDTGVLAVDAFHTNGGDERADVYTLVAAMDFLAERDVRIVNMSLAGPPNTVLEATVRTLAARDMVLIAATGNAGPKAKPAYPAAYPEVIAVTAVDRYGEVYRRAGRGSHVDLAAPGVNVWTAASVKGARPKSGTSFAVPFVTAAAAAHLAANPDLSGPELTALLTGSAQDLGAPGQDTTFGHGLVQAGPPCPPARALTAPLCSGAMTCSAVIGASLAYDR